MTREEMEEEAHFLHYELDRFCDDCGDPIVSHECAEIRGHIEYWDEAICEPGDICRRHDEYSRAQDRLDGLMAKLFDDAFDAQKEQEVA
jgi:hypothetical protein